MSLLLFEILLAYEKFINRCCLFQTNFSNFKELLQVKLS